MTDGDRSYWDKHAKNYDRSMSLLGRPIPRMVELAGERLRGLGRVLEVAAGTGLVTPRSPLAQRRSSPPTTRRRWSPRLSGVRAPGWRTCDASRRTSTPSASTTDRSDAVVAANVLHLVPDLTGAWRFDAW